MSLHCLVVADLPLPLSMLDWLSFIGVLSQRLMITFHLLVSTACWCGHLRMCVCACVHMCIIYGTQLNLQWCLSTSLSWNLSLSVVVIAALRVLLGLCVFSLCAVCGCVWCFKTMTTKRRRRERCWELRGGWVNLLPALPGPDRMLRLWLCELHSEVPQTCVLVIALAFNTHCCFRLAAILMTPFNCLVGWFLPRYCLNF